MAGEASFEANPDLGAELEADDKTKAVLEAKAKQIADAIVAHEPVRTGALEEFQAERISTEEGVVYLNNPIWHIIEFGSVHNPPYRPVAKGVQASGCRFEDARA